MRIQLALPVLATCLAAAVMPGAALAQETTDGLAGADVDTLRSEIGQRYDAALAATLDPAVINADDPRYTWASEAKVQCGIALGYLKSSTRDQTSISKCQTAYAMMTRQPALAAAPPPPPPPPQACPGDLPGMIFFDWDSDVPPVDGGQTAEFVARNAGPCGWTSFGATGHADRSGSDTAPSWACAGEVTASRSDAVARSVNLRMWTPDYLTVISTRRFCGSRTPSAVGTRGCSSPRASVVIDARGMPAEARRLATASARRRDSSTL